MAENQIKPQFRKEATPVLAEYQAKRRQALNQTAGRGFYAAPGFLHDIHTEIELEVKQKLSALNFQLHQAAVELEIKQAGLEYDIAYKNALMAWELEKQQLFADWERELAGIRQEQALEEEQIKALAREVARRGLSLGQAKASIAVEKEGLQQQIEALAGQTADYEVSLANARLLTAEKKLEVIPYLQRLVEIERDLVDKEWQLVGKNDVILGKTQTLLEKEQALQEKIGEVIRKTAEVVAANQGIISKEWGLLDVQQDGAEVQEDLISAQTDLAQLRQDELGPAMDDLVEVYQRYLTELNERISIYQDIIEVQGETADFEQQRLEKLGMVMEKQRQLADATMQLAEASANLAEHQAEVLVPEIANLAEAYDNLEGAIEQQIQIRSDTMDVKVDTERVALDRADKEAEVAEKNLETEELRRALSAAQNGREQARMILDKTLLSMSISDIYELIERENVHADRVNSEEQSVVAEEKDSRVSILQQALDRALSSHRTMKDAEEGTTRYVANRQEEATVRRAEINATPEITANLQHLLSM